MAAAEESVLKFPCEFPIKAMGRATDDFDALVVGIVRKHAPELTDTAVTTRHSREQHYVSVTITINAQSREQLDNIYMELAADKRVLVAL